MNEDGKSEWADLVAKASADAGLVTMRAQLAKFTALSFTRAGEELHAIGNIFGTDRIDGTSPGKNGSDEIVAMSLLLRIGGQLTSASADLFADGRHYAAAALLRQLVEIEYLAWAFQTRDKDAERWLRSTREERQSFFTPAKLRNASGGKFRGKDYGYHCELGGHPVPGSSILLQKESGCGQLLLADLLGHTGRIWGHLIDWAQGQPWVAPIANRYEEMFQRYSEWKKSDPINDLPPPP